MRRRDTPVLASDDGKSLAMMPAVLVDVGGTPWPDLLTPHFGDDARIDQARSTAAEPRLGAPFQGWDLS